MIDLKHLFSLPSDERDDEIWKLLYPEQWKSVKANCFLYWNLAMKMRDEVCETAIGRVNFETALRGIFIISWKGSHSVGLRTWLACYAQPCHYILAAIIVKEKQ